MERDADHNYEDYILERHQRPQYDSDAAASVEQCIY